MRFKLKRQAMFRSDCSRKVKLLRLALRAAGIHKNFSGQVAAFEKTAARPTENAEIWCNHGNWQGRLEYAPAWHYGQGVTAQFEGLSVRIPENFDAYLTQKYGDWRADLPEEEKVGHHFYGVLDLSKPFTEYL